MFNNSDKAERLGKYTLYAILTTQSYQNVGKLVRRTRILHCFKVLIRLRSEHGIERENVSLYSLENLSILFSDLFLSNK